jgi:hypothetical protein
VLCGVERYGVEQRFAESLCAIWRAHEQPGHCGKVRSLSSGGVDQPRVVDPSDERNMATDHAAVDRDPRGE